MIRLIGAVMIAACGTAAGVYFAAGVRAEVSEAERLLRIAEHIRYLVKYTEAPAESIITQVRERFGDISCRLSSGRNGRLRECAEAVEGLAERLGSFQLDEQIADCDRSIKHITRCMDELRADCRGRAKIWLALCSMAGLTLAILLI